jgi:hypothetical protein
MSNIRKQFEVLGFKFDKGKPVNGSQNLVGIYQTGAYVQIIGPAAKPSEQSLCVPVPATNKPVVDEGIKFIKEFLRLAVSEPGKAEAWIKDNVKEAVRQGGKRFDLDAKTKILLRGVSAADGVTLLITVSPNK